MTASDRIYREHERTDRWVVSYADFITLLFALFVLLYGTRSLDAVDAGAPPGAPRNELPKIYSLPLPLAQYTDMAGAGIVRGALMSPQLVLPRASSAARQSTRRAPASSVSGPVAPALESGKTEPLPQEPPRAVAGGPAPHHVSAPKTPDPFAAGPHIDSNLLLERRVRTALSGSLVEGTLELRRTEFGVEIDIRDTLLFDSASTALEDRAVPLLRGIARTLFQLPYRVRVEGYADDRPIRTAAFPSNWELSAARAASVVRLLSDFGLEPERLEAVGFGAHRPQVPNSSSAARHLNRRVIIVVTDVPDGDVSEPNSKRSEARDS